MFILNNEKHTVAYEQLFTSSHKKIPTNVKEHEIY